MKAKYKGTIIESWYCRRCNTHNIEENKKCSKCGLTFLLNCKKEVLLK